MFIIQATLSNLCDDDDDDDDDSSDSVKTDKNL